jgi:hypothetical protein
LERGAEMIDVALWLGVAVLFAILIYTAARPIK